MAAAHSSSAAQTAARLLRCPRAGAGTRLPAVAHPACCDLLLLLRQAPSAAGSTMAGGQAGPPPAPAPALGGCLAAPAAAPCCTPQTLYTGQLCPSRLPAPAVPAAAVGEDTAGTTHGHCQVSRHRLEAATKPMNIQPAHSTLTSSSSAPAAQCCWGCGPRAAAAAVPAGTGSCPAAGHAAGWLRHGSAAAPPLAAHWPRLAQPGP